MCQQQMPQQGLVSSVGPKQVHLPLPWQLPGADSQWWVLYCISSSLYLKRCLLSHVLDSGILFIVSFIDLFYILSEVYFGFSGEKECHLRSSSLSQQCLLFCNKGECVLTDDGPRCQCQPMYSGLHCEKYRLEVQVMHAWHSNIYPIPPITHSLWCRQYNIPMFALKGKYRHSPSPSLPLSISFHPLRTITKSFVYLQVFWLL